MLSKMQHDLPQKPDPFAVRMLKFNGWTVNLVERAARRGEETRMLEPIAARLLAFLAAHPGELISRERLRAAVWEGMSVSDDAILRSVSLIRRTFDDDPKSPAIIETVYRKGYRFVGTLEEDIAPAPAGAAQVTAKREASSPRVVLAAAGALLVLVAAGFLFAPRFAQPAHAPSAGGDDNVVSLDSAEAIERGDFFYYQHEPDKNELAIELYRKAIRADPNSSVAHAKLAMALSSRYARRRDPAVREEAAQAAQAAIWLAPEEAGGHEALGFLHLIDRNLDAAVERFLYAVERNPESEAAYHLGSAYLQAGNYPEAERWLLLAQKSSRLRDRAISVLGEVKYRSGRMSEAKAWFEKASDVLPLNEFASIRLGQIAAIQGDLDGLAPCRELRARMTSETFCEIVILDALIAAGDYDGAVSHLESRPPDGSYYELHALVRRLHIDVAREGLNGANVAALEDALDRINILPGGRPVWLRAVLLALLERDDEAFEALERAKAEGWVNFQWDRIEPAFSSLRDDPRFADYVAAPAPPR